MRRPSWAIVAWALAAAPASAAPFPADDALAALVWKRNPEVRQAVLAAGQARTDVLRAGTLPNPGVALGIQSLPFEGQAAGDPPTPINWAHAPSYTVDLTQGLDLWKRPLRVRRAELGVELAGGQAADLHLQRTADLLAVEVRLAAARLRLALLARQGGELAETLRLLALATREGQSAPLELARLRLEQQRGAAQLARAQVAYLAARADWQALVLQPPPEPQEAEARDALLRLAELPPEGPVASVPPKARLAARLADQARVDAELARKGWLPDVELHLGYTRSTLAGNAPDSAQGGVNLVVPFWDRGEADALDAASKLAVATSQAEAQGAAAAQQGASLRRQALALGGILRQQQVSTAAARAILARLDAALLARGTTLGDVIQARRAVLDLEGDQVDLLEQLASAVVDFRRLTAWRLPAHDGVTP